MGSDPILVEFSLGRVLTEAKPSDCGESIPIAPGCSLQYSMLTFYNHDQNSCGMHRETSVVSRNSRSRSPEVIRYLFSRQVRRNTRDIDLELRTTYIDRHGCDAGALMQARSENLPQYG
jgi:hypothetical protein